METMDSKEAIGILISIMEEILKGKVNLKIERESPELIPGMYRQTITICGSHDQRVTMEYPLGEFVPDSVTITDECIKKERRFIRSELW